MVIFNQGYYHPMDRAYNDSAKEEKWEDEQLSKPISVKDLGQTVTEGRAAGGNFIQSLQAAIRKGTASVELATQMEGTDQGVGAEAYGRDAREAIRELAEANEVKIGSIHSPSQIGNMSGFAGVQHGFSDEQRDLQVREIKKAIDFAADVARGGAVVVHTGEFPRTMFDAPWNKEGEWSGKFSGYAEEETRAVKHLVDKRTGNIVQAIRLNQQVARAAWNKAKGSYNGYDQDGNPVTVNPGDYIDYDGRLITDPYDNTPGRGRVPEYDKETNKFNVVEVGWQDFVQEAKERNEINARKYGLSLEQLKERYPDQYFTPEEAFLHATTETQEKIALGWAGQYSDRLPDYIDAQKKLREAKEFYEKLESNIPPEERWKIEQRKDSILGNLEHLGIIPSEKGTPLEIIKEKLKDINETLENNRQMVQGQLQQAKEQEILRKNTTTVEKYAKEKSFDSLADVGIYAMDLSTEKGLSRPIYIAPENIFPEMGYGSHPRELIELVSKSRETMAQRLMEERGMSKDEAFKHAKDHIKATFDTQHLGMWRKHFEKKAGETEEQHIQRFNNWYRDQVKELSEAEILGNIHIVDGFGRGHTHLPAGQGNLPVVDAVTYLKKHGFVGQMSSEGFGEPTRQLTETWRAFGSPIYGSGGPIRVGAPRTWTDVEHSYFGKNTPPYYIFGSYSPSNDWTLWTQVPLE